MKKSLLFCFLPVIVVQLACNSISLNPQAEPTPVDGAKATMEDISFKRGLITFSGALILPPEKDIVAAVVFVHGSGKEGRDIQLAKKFAREGIAILVYDKRGAGLSGGDYMEENTASKMMTLADDAVAAIELLKTFPQIKDKPIGLVGFDEAGWIIPMAAMKSKDVKFMGLWGGPVAKLSEVSIYSLFTSGRDIKDAPTYEQMASLGKKVPALSGTMEDDFDPAELLVRLKIPGFWIFGKNDGYTPVDISVEDLEQLKNGGAKYDYAVFAGKGHDLLNETFTSMTGWIKAINDPAAMTAWVKQVKDSALIDNSTPVKNDNLGKYAGTYGRSDTPLKVTIKQKDKKLLVVEGGKSVEMIQTDDDSFYFKNEYGYAFLDFEPEQQRLRIEQMTSVYSLDKQSQ